MKFWVPWCIDAAVALVTVYFFLVGIGDGSVSSFNGVHWAGMLSAVAGVTGGGLWLRKRGKGRAAVALLWVLAVPGLAALFFVLLVIILHPRWN